MMDTVKTFFTHREIYFEGPFGNLVSHFVCLQLARALLEGPIYLIDPVAAMKDAFSKAELALRTYVHKKVIKL